MVLIWFLILSMLTTLRERLWDIPSGPFQKLLSEFQRCLHQRYHSATKPGQEYLIHEQWLEACRAIPGLESKLIEEQARVLGWRTGWTGLDLPHGEDLECALRASNPNWALELFDEYLATGPDTEWEKCAPMSNALAST